MKKIELCLAISLLVLLQAGFNVSKAFASYSLNDYYPTSQGSSWTYDVTRSNPDGSGAWTRSEGANINGFETVAYPDGSQYAGYKFWWYEGSGSDNLYDVEKLTDAGVKGIKGVEGEGGYNLYGTLDSTEPNHPILWFPRTFDIGTQGEYSYKTYNYSDAGILQEVAVSTMRYEVSGFEDVTVPAGSFNNALKLLFMDTEFHNGQSPDWGQVDTEYFAKGVGLIKYVELTSDGVTPNALQTGVLTSYTVTPEPVSCALFLVGGGALALIRRKKVI